MAASFAFKGENMKKFRIQIKAYDYAADFQISAEDTREGIEKAILDKLGQKDVKWEKDGFSDSSRRKWITYEEVINDSRPIHYESGPWNSSGNKST